MRRFCGEDLRTTARAKFGVDLAAAIIEWQQGDMRNQLCDKDPEATKGLGAHAHKWNPTRQCRCRRLRKEGCRSRERLLMTELGLISFRVAYVSCRQ